MDNLEKLEEICIKAIKDFMDELCRRNPEKAEIKIDTQEIIKGICGATRDNHAKSEATSEEKSE